MLIWLKWTAVGLLAAVVVVLLILAIGALLSLDWQRRYSKATAALPLFGDLASTIRDCDLERSLFLDLLDAFAQDLEVGRYRDRDELRDYCRRSADPIGRLVLRVCGYRDDALDRLSDEICTGLQLLNHVLDLLGGVLCTLRQRPHLVGNDGEPTSLLSGASGLDRSIEGEQIGLIRDAANHVQYGANAFHVILKLAHQL